MDVSLQTTTLARSAAIPARGGAAAGGSPPEQSARSRARPRADDRSRRRRGEVLASMARPIGPGPRARRPVSRSLVGAARTSSGACRSPAAATRRRSSGATGSSSPPPTTADNACRSSRLRRIGRKAAVGDVRAAARLRARTSEERPCVRDAGHRRPPRLCVVRQPRAAGRRFRRQDRVAPPVGRTGQLSRQRRVAGPCTRTVSSSTRITTAARRAARSSPPSTTETGKPLWQTPRDASVGWGTPVVITAGGRDELIVSSQRRVQAYDPATGKELWSVARQHLRGDSDAGRRPRPRLLRVGPRRPDDRDPPRRQRRRHRHARRVVGRQRVAVRAVTDARRRCALPGQRHAEHRHRLRGEDRRAALPGPARHASGARASRRRRWR